MGNSRSRSRSPDVAAHDASPDDREWRARATRATRANGPHTDTSAIDAPSYGGDTLRLLFDRFFDAVCATDATNRFTHWPVSAERPFGYSAAEAVAALSRS